MKTVKSLVLGSAAVLLAMSAAQAADLPIKAKAVEYVKVCSLYGAGFYYIPGTDTCIKLGGYLRAETAIATNSDFNGTFSGQGGAHNRLSNYYTARARQDINIDTRTATEYGVVRTFADLTFSWTSGGYAGTGSATGATAYSTAGAPGAQADGNIAQGSVGVYYAFIQFAGFTMGKAVSQFDTPWVNYPGNNFDGLAGGGGTVTGVNQFSYTADFGSGITATVSAQDATAYYQNNLWNVAGSTAAGVIGGAYGTSNYGGNVSPDFVGMVRVDQAWGLFQASFAAHDNHVAYYGASETSGHPADKWGWAAQLALSIKNIPTGPGDTINVQGVYTNGASRYNIQSLMPNSYAMYGSTGLAGAYQSLGIAGVGDSVFTTGGEQQLTTTYGVRGAYTHNWNPAWNTAIYGSWAAVRYNGTAKGLICTSPGVVATFNAGSTCNPDFDLATIGLITRWTPVKNLTFSADFAYSWLDQKHSGSVTAPAAAAVAKPAAVYELKDQQSAVLLLRAQRNF
ncbi:MULTISPECIES: porin [unclassified Bradyrhizobium]|uniref:porin n=1 Tax=unclassified Bradyrhizobium TaxID=2631580 RepID=UPI0028E4AA3B|nr:MULTISPECIES: porin [unclassified Bradyrhizobium]